MSEIVYFELNNWFRGEHYPDAEPFTTWMKNDCKIQFANEQWVKENKLCVVASIVDMSQNFCITATKKWVENNCPSLLSEYSKFLRTPDEDGYVEGQFGSYFLDYNDNNIGITWDNEDDEYYNDEDEE